MTTWLWKMGIAFVGLAASLVSLLTLCLWMPEWQITMSINFLTRQAKQREEPST